MTCRHTVSLGAYLLGALDPADRSAFEEHMSTCPTCKAELLRLAPLPGLLQRLTPEDYAAIEQDDAQPPPEPWLVAQLEPVPVAQPDSPPAVRPRRGWLRRHGLALAAAAAVVLLAFGGVFVFRPVGGSSETALSPVTWSAVDPDTGVTGRVELTSRAWGTEVKVSMQDVPSGRKICHLIVYSRDGSSEVAGKWTAGYYREVRAIPGSSSIRLKDIDRVEVVAAGGILVGIHSP